MLKFLTILILLGGLAYLANYFYNNSMQAARVNGAYREMNGRSCLEVSASLEALPDTENRKKADIYLNELAASHFSTVSMNDITPAQRNQLVAAFQRECAGNPGLPGQEIMARITREEILGAKE